MSVTPSTVAVIVVTPAFFAVTRPVADTVATFVSDELKDTLCAFLVMCNCFVLPAFNNTGDS